MACNSIDYQFTKVPTKLFLCLDNNCRSMLYSLIQLSTMFADEQGWFFRSNADLEAETGLSKKVMDGVLDALLVRNIIDFIPQQQGKGVKQTSRLYCVNFQSFLEYETIPIDDCIKNPKYRILTSDYKGGSFCWQGKEWAGKKASLSLSSSTTSSSVVEPTSTPTSPQPQPKVPTSIDTTDIEENKNIKILNINYLNNDLTSSEGKDAKHNACANNIIPHPSSSFVDSLEVKDEAEQYYPSSRSSSSVHDDCLNYIITHRAPHSNDGLDVKVYYEYLLASALVKMVNREVKHLPNDESIFFGAVKNYMDLYGVNKERAIKDINILKSRATKIRDEQLKAS